MKIQKRMLILLLLHIYHTTYRGFRKWLEENDLTTSNSDDFVELFEKYYLHENKEEDK